MANRIYFGESNIISMTRGDTHTFNLSIEDETAEDGLYRLAADDCVYVGIMIPHQKFEEAIVRKKYVQKDQDLAGNILVTIEPDDTLDLDPGTYYYAAKLQRGTQVTTVINKTKFVIFD